MSTPATRDISLYRGDDYTHVLTFVDNQEPPEALDLSGDYTFKAQIRDRPENGTVVHATFDIDITQANLGIIVLSLPDSQTRFPPAYWDLEVNDGATTQTWLKGTVLVSGDVTQDVTL